VKVGASNWSIRMSCPQFPGKKYMLVAGMAGIRPGVKLPDGRRIWLNPDVVTYATMFGWLPGIWNGGPGVLDSNGEAQAALNLGSLSIPSTGLGLPFWMTLIVLDPAAPSGVAYLPDTYVMRL
jgi:hypothetical protein